MLRCYDTWIRRRVCGCSAVCLQFFDWIPVRHAETCMNCVQVLVPRTNDTKRHYWSTGRCCQSKYWKISIGRITCIIRTYPYYVCMWMSYVHAACWEFYVCGLYRTSYQVLFTGMIPDSQNFWPRVRTNNPVLVWSSQSTVHRLQWNQTTSCWSCLVASRGSNDSAEVQRTSTILYHEYSICPPHCMTYVPGTYS